MIELFSTEFWIVLQFFVTFFLVVFLFILVKKINRLDIRLPKEALNDDGADEIIVSGQASKIINLLEPLVKESRQAAIRFDEQVKEKKRLIKELNDALDTRIININLLLSRADALQNRLENTNNPVNSSFPSQGDIMSKIPPNAGIDQQDQIIEMYNQDVDVDGIAQRLSIPKGEVQLVIDLKKKFIAMEKNSR